ncbi:hypothetical protein K503DRAFT_770790 [Rhizopogon vinicolor AM-OR11-026]|uniref:BZIP domain-containing protein n=1 Tax=Rhizopogon vinicolor AM-OR11-026 TaxID=1314800 RepID=A0A1B7MZW0_9AGAM|nr:hypothetical protein K503DRAFT_770790 [Rhizopogon vinicolor AM-OR11-026]
MQTRAKATTSVPAHDAASISAPPTPATNSTPVRTVPPHTRSKGPAPLVALDPNTGALPQTRTPLTIRIPRTSLSNAHDVVIPTDNVPTIPQAPPPPAPAPVASALTHAPAPSVQTPDQPIYTFPPPPPPSQTAPTPSHADNPAASPMSPPAPASSNTNAVAQSPMNGKPNASPSRARAPRTTMVSTAQHERRHGALRNAPLPPPPAQSPAQPPAQPVTQPPVQPPVQPPTQLSPQPRIEFLPPVPHADLDSDYGGDLMDMDIDAQDLSMLVNSSTEAAYVDKHREANKKYRQRLKERIQNGEIDEIEAARRREKKRINARNARARRKAMKEAAPEEGDSQSVDPAQLAGPGTPSGDSTPAPGDFLLCLPDTNPPAGSYYSTTFHEILTKANSASSDSTTSVGYIHHEPESASAPPVSVPLPSASYPPAPLPSASRPSAPLPSTSLSSASFPSDHLSYSHLPYPDISSAPFQSAPPPTAHVPTTHIPTVRPSAPRPRPITKPRKFRDAGIMTEPVPEPTKEDEPSLDPLPPTLARHPHRQLTAERLQGFQTNPLELIDKAFLLIVPDASSSLGKLILCKVIEHRVSSAGHRFLVQFWGDATASEMGVEMMLDVLAGGYEIDPPPVNTGPGSEPQPSSGMTGRFFGALRSLTGF